MDRRWLPETGHSRMNQKDAGDNLNTMKGKENCLLLHGLDKDTNSHFCRLCHGEGGKVVNLWWNISSYSFNSNNSPHGLG